MTWKENTKYEQLEFLYRQYYTNRKKEKKHPSQKNYNNTSRGNFFFFFLNDKFTLLDMCRFVMI